MLGISNEQVKVNQQYLVRHLMELGYLHNKVKQHIGSLFTEVGTVAQGLMNAVRRELTQYYQALAVLDSQVTIVVKIHTQLFSRNLPT